MGDQQQAAAAAAEPQVDNVEILMSSIVHIHQDPQIVNRYTDQWKSIMTHTDFDWRIEDFKNNLNSKDPWIESSVLRTPFSKHHPNDLSLMYQIYPKKPDMGDVDREEVYIGIQKYGRGGVMGKVKLCAKNPRDHTASTFFIEASYIFPCFHSGLTQADSCILKRVTRDELRSAMFDTDSLHLHMTISEVNNCRGPLNWGCGNHPELVLEKMYSTEDLMDCRIEVGNHGSIVKVHRCVLAAHSEVFHSMFREGESRQREDRPTTRSLMKEARTGVIEMKDTNLGAVEGMVEYMYNGHSKKIDKYAQDILVLANKYGINKLKTKCEKSLLSQMNPENVCNLLLFSINYRALALKEGCARYIAQHRGCIPVSESWETLKSNQEATSVLLDLAYLPQSSSEIKEQCYSNKWTYNLSN